MIIRSSNLSDIVYFLIIFVISTLFYLSLIRFSILVVTPFRVLFHLKYLDFLIPLVFWGQHPSTVTSYIVKSGSVPLFIFKLSWRAQLEISIWQVFLPIPNPIISNVCVLASAKAPLIIENQGWISHSSKTFHFHAQDFHSPRIHLSSISWKSYFVSRQDLVPNTQWNVFQGTLCYILDACTGTQHSIQFLETRFSLTMTHIISF